MTISVPNHLLTQNQKSMVLCVTRHALTQFGIPMIGYGLYEFDPQSISIDNYHFINRHVVDNKIDDGFQQVGYQLPQVLPYVAVTDGQGKYLSYSRNGQETRLHGSRSIGIGGHVDYADIKSYIDDMIDKNGSNASVFLGIQMACLRELVEEINCNWTVNHGLDIKLDRLILDTTNSVGKVHIGYFSEIVYPEAEPQEELHDAKWLTADELKADIDLYENWSKIIINSLL